MAKVVEAEKKQEQAASRKAYGDALAVLRENHRPEFDALLDAAYAANGLVSPAQKRVARVAAEAEARAVADRVREEKRLAKIAKMEAELAELKAAQLPLESDVAVAEG